MPATMQRHRCQHNLGNQPLQRELPVSCQKNWPGKATGKGGLFKHMIQSNHDGIAEVYGNCVTFGSWKCSCDQIRGLGALCWFRCLEKNCTNLASVCRGTTFPERGLPFEKVVPPIAGVQHVHFVVPCKCLTPCHLAHVLQERGGQTNMVRW